MRNREDYKNKIYTELELVQIKFAQFKAQGQNLDTDSRARHNRHVEEIEKHIIATNTKLKDLSSAHDDAWEELVDGVENTWRELQSTLEDAFTSFND